MTDSESSRTVDGTGSMGTFDDVVPPQLEGRVKAVNRGVVELEGVCRNGAF